MAAALPFGLVYLIPATLVLGWAWGGAWTFSTVVFVFVMTPVLDGLLGVRTDTARSTPADWLYDAWLWLWPAVQVALLGIVLREIAYGRLTTLETIGLVLSLGIVAGGGGITIAHELMHRASPRAQAAAEGLMALVTYPHFCVEHVLGHHRTVATPDDPASARRGEPVYAFLARTIAGGLASAWRLERQRVAKMGLRPFGWRDRRLRQPIEVAVLYAAVAAGFGLAGVGVLAAQSAVAIVLLEVINYVEHYGLRRALGDNGRYERVSAKHSWNSSHKLTGWYLFNLPRHADHHFEARRPYKDLRHLDDSPQLPLGYATMVLVALVPPLWFAIMDGRVDAWNARVATDAA